MKHEQIETLVQVLLELLSRQPKTPINTKTTAESPHASKTNSAELSFFDSFIPVKPKRGSKVQWKWLGRTIDGKVEDVFTESVTREIKGAKITRHGTAANPAYLVRSESGNIALKLGTELHAPNGNADAKAKTKSKAKPTPKLFS